MVDILDAVEHSLDDFRPRTSREFVALQIARRFDDLGRLARFLNIGRDCPKNLMLEAARLAAQQAPADLRQAADRFFDLVEQFRKEEAHE